MNILRPIVCRNLLRNTIKISLPANSKIININNKDAYWNNQTVPFSTANLSSMSTNDGILKKIVKKFVKQNVKSKLLNSGLILYENIADGLDYSQFFRAFDMKDAFNSWFLITELHVWLLSCRVMQEGPNNNEDGRFLRNCIVEAMWSDVQQRSKKLGSDNPSFTRQQVTILSEQFQASLISYDEGLSFDDKALASALWRRFFEAQCDDFTKVEMLVKYVRKTTLMFDNLSREQLVTNPRIEWLPLKE